MPLSINADADDIELVQDDDDDIESSSAQLPRSGGGMAAEPGPATGNGTGGVACI